ncbi:MAG: flagellar L-ring protein FlgH [Thermovirga sp.]|nr:MAG: Flagellar L-ring protein [Thermovirga lienii]MDN5318989.1 flagellar L-ring protein FlgH [Thermovirga sp.]MDN5368228.1 flagellar L-ring protein FlgH [Thermovirga sp.]
MKAVKSVRKVLLSFLVCILIPSVVFGESLWVDGPSLVADHRPSKVGDIVTVIVSDKTQAKNEAATDLNKQSSLSAGDGLGILDFIKKLGLSTSSSATGDGSTERKYNFTTTITCMVTEVLPGGNLRLEGSKDIKVHKDTVTLKVEGVIRPQDVGPDNTIESDRLANVVVRAEGIGSISDLQNPGLLTRLFNAIF